MIFFESPHRIAATVSAAADIFGKARHAVVCRELTKTFEEFRRGTLEELVAYYDDERVVKGEIVLLVGPPQEKDLPGEVEVDVLLRRLASEMPSGKAATEAASLTGLPRKDLYQRLLALKDNSAGG